VFEKLNLKRTADWAAIGGRAGVGMPFENSVENVWTDEQLGLEDGSAPEMLEGGRKMEISLEGAKIALSRMSRLLGKASVKTEAIGITFEPLEEHEDLRA
jgi:5-aminolevulinate synthase